MSRFEIGQKVTYSPNGETYTIAAAAPDSAGCLAVLNNTTGRYTFMHEDFLEPIPVVQATVSIWFGPGGFSTGAPSGLLPIDGSCQARYRAPGDRKLGTLSMMSDGTVRFEAET